MALEGEFVYAPPGYAEPLTNLGNARLQAVVRQPLYAGGALKAAAAKAEAGVEAARGRYRMVEKDLDLDVRGRFSELLAIDAEISIRSVGLEELEELPGLPPEPAGLRAGRRRRPAQDGRPPRPRGGHAGRSRTAPRRRTPLLERAHGSGPGLAARARTASVLPSRRGRRRRPRGRAPPRSASPRPRPGRPRRRSSSPRPNAGPRLLLAADAGFWTDDTTHLIPASGTASGGTRATPSGSSSPGTSGIRARRSARIAEAGLGLQQSRLELEVGKRDARLAWEKARSALAHVYQQIEILSRALPAARDSYLDAQSRYRGGAATALEVLDAHAAASRRPSDATTPWPATASPTPWPCAGARLETARPPVARPAARRLPGETVSAAAGGRPCGRRDPRDRRPGLSRDPVGSGLRPGPDRRAGSAEAAGSVCRNADRAVGQRTETVFAAEIGWERSSPATAKRR